MADVGVTDSIGVLADAPGWDSRAVQSSTALTNCSSAVLKRLSSRSGAAIQRDRTIPSAVGLHAEHRFVAAVGLEIRSQCLLICGERVSGRFAHQAVEQQRLLRPVNFHVDHQGLVEQQDAVAGLIERQVTEADGSPELAQQRLDRIAVGHAWAPS